MNMEDVKRTCIDLGKLLLKRDSNGSWDFYHNNNGNHKRYTYEEFEKIEIKADKVYVSKKEGLNRRKIAIYTITGEEIISFDDSVIVYGDVYIVEKCSEEGWDFYSKDGNPITSEKFFEIAIAKHLVAVCKRNSNRRLVWGVYNCEGNKIMTPQWKEVLICQSKITGKLAYILVRDFSNNWGIYDLDGSVIIEPKAIESIKWMNNSSGEYLILRSTNGSIEKYIITGDGIKK